MTSFYRVSLRLIHNASSCGRMCVSSWVLCISGWGPAVSRTSRLARAGCGVLHDATSVAIHPVTVDRPWLRCRRACCPAVVKARIPGHVPGICGHWFRDTWSAWRSVLQVLKGANPPGGGGGGGGSAIGCTASACMQRGTGGHSVRGSKHNASGLQQLPAYA